LWEATVTAYWKCTACRHIATEASHGTYGCAVRMAAGNACGCKVPRGEAPLGSLQGLQRIAQRLDDDPTKPVDTDVYVGWAAEVRQCVRRLGYKILPCVDMMAPIARADGSTAGYYTAYDNGRAEAEFPRARGVPCGCAPRRCGMRQQMDSGKITSAMIALAMSAGVRADRRGGRWDCYLSVSAEN
jgi:hypothetical protein